MRKLIVASPLTEAIKELAEELRAGTGDKASLIQEIAEEHGVNPTLLGRKFDESYPSGVGEALPTLQENVKRKVAELVEHYVKNYRIDPKRVVDFIHKNGNRYTGIARIGRDKVLAVSHKDAMGYNVRPENIHQVLWEKGQDPRMNDTA